MIKYLFNWKYRYFRKLVQDADQRLAELEFKIYSARELREEARQDYDGGTQRLSMLREQIAAEDKNPKLSKDERARLDDQEVLLKKDIETAIEGLKSLDKEIEGSRKTNELPDGYHGMVQEVDAWKARKEMILDYMEKNL